MHYNGFSVMALIIGGLILCFCTKLAEWSNATWSRRMGREAPFKTLNLVVFVVCDTAVIALGIAGLLGIAHPK